MHSEDQCLPVHRRPAEDSVPDFNRRYGLWIFASGRGGVSRPMPAAPALRCFEFFALSHLYDGFGHFFLRGKPDCDIRPGDCVIVTPGLIHRYGGWGGRNYCEDTVNFFGPVADMLLRAGVIEPGIIHAGHVRRLLPVIEYLQDPALDSQLKACIELQKLLTDFYLEKRLNRAEYPLFDQLLREITTHLDRWWTVGEMAERCNLSCDQLRRVFLKYTGGTPKLYLDRLKLRHAGELLTGTAMSLSEIAASLGYVDVYHFCRRFKEIMGMAPGQFRQTSGIPPAFRQ